jgi:hypothetical protein
LIGSAARYDVFQDLQGRRRESYTAKSVDGETNMLLDALICLREPFHRVRGYY